MTTQSAPRRPVLRYHGSKWRIAPWIISHFPPHRVYVEPFGGGAGGETGPRARPMNPDWARSIRDQCKVARVPFFFKKMAGNAPTHDDLLVREVL